MAHSGGTSIMSVGLQLRSEAREFRDPATGRRIRQVTSHPSMHHHPFFFVPAYDMAMRRLLFVSCRTGRPQIYFEDRASGTLVQVTDRDDLADWSISPSLDGRYVYYTAGTGAWRTDLASLQDDQLAAFGDVEMRESGMVAAALGTTALSADGRWWAVPVKAGKASRLWLIDTAEKTATIILERDTIGHPQFCPDDADLILYAGPLTDRTWVTDRAGRTRRLYQRRDRLQWVTHESFIPRRFEVAFVDWPHGVRAVSLRDGAERTVTTFPAWHAACDATGTTFVCDTNFPDRGLHRFAAVDGSGAELVCLSEASSQGAHWAHPFPYNDGPVAVDAPQHTHPHPRFSPDGSRIVFTSDRSGHAQIYEVLLGDP
jgi:oligogalacturonide lyase